jgi:hypothetical protein
MLLERWGEDDVASLAQCRKELLDQEEGCADVDSEQAVELPNGRVFDSRWRGNTGVGDQNIETVVHDRADPLGERVRAVRIAQVGGNLLGLAASLADFGNDRVRFFLTAAVVNQHSSARLLGQAFIARKRKQKTKDR